MYDPSTNSRFIMDKGTGKIIPVPAENGETGNNPSKLTLQDTEDIDTARMKISRKSQMGIFRKELFSFPW